MPDAKTHAHCVKCNGLTFYTRANGQLECTTCGYIGLPTMEPFEGDGSDGEDEC